MQKLDYDYISLLFRHFDIEVNSIQDVSSARHKLFQKNNINISFSEIYKSFKYSDNVFNFYNPITKEKIWYKNFDDLLVKLDKENNSTLLISMPRNATRHEVLLKNNKHRIDMKNILGYYPEIRYSPFGKPITRLHVSDFNFDDKESVCQIASILNNFDEIDKSSPHGNDTYKISTKGFLNLYGKIKDFEMLLTNLRFAGIRLTKVEILTTEDYYND
jgi:hypothetical protein